MVRPVGNRLVVETISEERKVGSIVLAGSTEDGVAKGKVVAVGPGGVGFQGERVPLEVVVGDEVLFHAYRGTLVRDTDGASLKVLDETDVIAVIE